MSSSFIDNTAKVLRDSGAFTRAKVPIGPVIAKALLGFRDPKNEIKGGRLCYRYRARCGLRGLKKPFASTGSITECCERMFGLVKATLGICRGLTDADDVHAAGEARE